MAWLRILVLLAPPLPRTRRGCTFDELICTISLTTTARERVVDERDSAGMPDTIVTKIDHDTTIRSALTSSIEWKWCKASSSLPSSCRNEKLTIFRAKKGSSRPKTTRNFNDATDEIASTRAIDYWYHYVTINKLSILTKEMTTASASLGYIVKTNVDAVFTASLRSARRRRRIIILIV